MMLFVVDRSMWTRTMLSVSSFVSFYWRVSCASVRASVVCLCARSHSVHRSPCTGMCVCMCTTWVTEPIAYVCLTFSFVRIYFGFTTNDECRFRCNFNRLNIFRNFKRNSFILNFDWINFWFVIENDSQFEYVTTFMCNRFYFHLHSSLVPLMRARLSAKSFECLV